MTTPASALLADLNSRSREVFRRVVESYLQTGDPVGSRTLQGSLSEQVSAATIRNVMQDLEAMGLLDHPHTSAGRRPTHVGLRLFVDALMEAGPVAATDRAAIEATLGPAADPSILLDRMGMALSQLTQGASLVLTPKQEAPIRHIEFVSLAPDRALVVLVFADGRVENRVFTPPPGQSASSMREAGNFINAHARGRTLAELAAHIQTQVTERRAEIDSLAAELVASGLALWQGGEASEPRLIVRGQANLLAEDAADLDRIRVLFDDLERKRDIAEFLSLAEEGDGVRIFIGAENKLFSLSGSSLVVSPYMNADRKIVGAVGVIGPTRLNYGRIVPLVDLTAQLVGRALSGRHE
ncbi:heat-inducible transcriptional repressor HrcA [Paracoccus suum]|uniref:Heat-inducible transcription repressor HrcA n=1 Tax=Paracoccus suum TaxID=2259340 RepID=A0A344PHT9_9RHOB|nr:heat-inducible transcriptional repressor HrcA [Paracoccus suum]AXC48944.1 heat-inducible transcriptional repressor HrcA [Paracoccus suum]